MKQLIRRVVLFLLFIGLNKIALAEDKPSSACLAGKAELIGSCLDEAYTKWDKKLNDTYKNVMGYLSKDKKTELRNQQRTWLKERANRCDGLSSENAIKACNLDEAQLKALALEDQEADLMPKMFEGNWRMSYGKDAVYDKFSAQDGYLLFQKGKNICGTWLYYATGLYEGLLYGKLVTPTKAKIFKRCGRITATINTECWEDIDKWDDSSDFLKIGKDGLYSFIVDKAGKRQLSQKERDKYLKEHQWIQKCLSHKE